jgi:hypothetical protein
MERIFTRTEAVTGKKEMGEKHYGQKTNKRRPPKLPSGDAKPQGTGWDAVQDQSRDSEMTEADVADLSEVLFGCEMEKDDWWKKW